MDAASGVTPGAGTSQQDMTKINQSIAFNIALGQAQHTFAEMMQASNKEEQKRQEMRRESGES